jgi:hypothetical protein
MKKIQKKEIKKLEELSKGGKIYTAGSGYSGGWKTAYDDTSSYEIILKICGIKFQIKNDAPKGGLNGKHIICRKFNFEKAKEKLENFRKVQEIKKELKNELIDSIFCQTSLSGKKYFGYSKPYNEFVPEMTARLNGENLEIRINGEWKVCRK